MFHSPFRLFAALLLAGMFAGCSASSKMEKQNPAAGDFYELRTYHIQNKSQEQNVDNYLQQAFLPTLHRAGWSNIGVFKPIDSDTAYAGKRVYVLIPARSLEALAGLPDVLQKDAAYALAAPAYQNGTQENTPYKRMEVSWLTAFSGHRHFTLPDIKTPRSERIYEIRSYESPSEKLAINKVQMFNAADEIGLFDRLGFNAMFYGSALSGAHMPNLVYMIGFDNTTARDAHWKAFVDSPEWKKMNTLPEYQIKNVSHIDSYLLHPTSYSDY